MRNILWGLVCATLFGCGSYTKKVEGDSLKLYVLDCGQIFVSNIAVFNPNLKKEKRELANSCYLINKGDKYLLWDAGVSDEIGKLPNKKKKINDLFSFGVRKTLLSQLQEIGVKPEQVNYLGFSHFHLDHTGNTKLFPNAKWLIQKTEYDFARTKNASNSGYNPEDYLRDIQKKSQIVEGDYDVFGDGSVQLLSTPGHTPGHQSLLVKLPQYGNLVLSGDLYHFEKNLKERGIPVWNNEEVTKKSFDRMDEILKKHQAKIWIQHDPKEFSERKKSPKFYE